MSRMVSPNDLHNAAKAEYCDGRDPSTKREWQQCINFWAENIISPLEESACLLMSRIYDCPLPDDQIREIASFQFKQKA
jgi:hypothetical protein